MFWINTKRVLVSGSQNFLRNGFVTLSSILIMVITLFIICSLILLGGFFNYSLNQIKEKVDINVYFVTNAEESNVLATQKSLEGLPEVDSVTYVSREQAISDFKERHKGDELTLQSLDELGYNPLGASLNIKAKDPSQYAGIAEFLKGNNLLSKNGTSIIDKVNYTQNKVVIDKFSNIIDSANTLGITLAIVFILISIIITLNTIRLTIFMAKDEIAVMRLVGASSKFIKGPFIVGGILCGIVSAIIILFAFAIITFWINHSYAFYFSGFNLFDYYITNFVLIFSSIFGLAILLGAVASYLAAHRYLRE